LRSAGLRARGGRAAGGSSREFLGGSRRLCGASRELWEDCWRFSKGSGRKILIFHWFLKVLGGNHRQAGGGLGSGLGPPKSRFLRKSTKAKPKGKGKGKAKDKNAGVIKPTHAVAQSAVADIYY